MAYRKPDISTGLMPQFSHEADPVWIPPVPV